MVFFGWQQSLPGPMEICQQGTIVLGFKGKVSYPLAKPALNVYINVGLKSTYVVMYSEYPITSLD